jgi:hypothetical protein
MKKSNKYFLYQQLIIYIENIQNQALENKILLNID